MKIFKFEFRVLPYAWAWGFAIIAAPTLGRAKELFNKKAYYREYVVTEVGVEEGVIYCINGED